MDGSAFGTLGEILSKRVMVLDGAMGTMVQALGLGEDGFRGDLLRGHGARLRGDIDILALTRPDVIGGIHRQYLEAGADIIETCTFGSQRVSQAEYRTQDLVRPMNLAAAALARREADRMTALTPSRPRFVAGSIGPTGKMASMSPDMDDPAFRAVTFDSLLEAYAEQVGALIEGGVDILLVETVFDTLNAKAALEACRLCMEGAGRRLPVMLSATIADASGRLLSGQTLEAFLESVAHAGVFSVGLNCSFGARRMEPFLRRLSHLAPCFVSAHPNAGLPDVDGRYGETPEAMARDMGDFASEGLVNIVGGCCGSTPAHIRAMAGEVSRCGRPRVPAPRGRPGLAGLERLAPESGFMVVGERCNVAGSRRFLRLIAGKSYDEALAVARAQARDGAMALDINMDDGMLDAGAEMPRFLFLLASDPETARIPWMIDSSRFDVIEAGLKCVQGKAIVNSISLKDGEAAFLGRAARVRQLGAAVVVMAFDEEGQATTFERKVEICSRAYRLLTGHLGFDPGDLIFDPNVLAVATGMREHDAYGLDFIRATRWIHDNLPGARVSAGVSNLSFSFRGNDYVRGAMHAVFLHHAIRAGLDMAIMNPSAQVAYDDVPGDLLEAIEDVILCRREDATERLVAMARDLGGRVPAPAAPSGAGRAGTVGERLARALREGDDGFLEGDILEALECYPSPQAIIEGPLMDGMRAVGELFAQGRMFLPQVVRTSRTMRRAVDLLAPRMGAGRAGRETPARNGKYLLATVKGDVHDIGKNIVSVVMGCNDFDVIDLGVMVPAERIVEAAVGEGVDFVALSGLITPSLDEMCNVARELERAGVRVPLFVGGATTSDLHTACRIAPLYSGPVFRLRDASENPVVAMSLRGEGRDRVVACLRYGQERLRREACRSEAALAAAGESRGPGPVIDWEGEDIHPPTFRGTRMVPNISIAAVRPYINWRQFYRLWGVGPDSPEALGIRREAEALIDGLAVRHHLRAQIGFFAAYGTGGSIVVTREAPVDGAAGVSAVEIATPRQRRAPGDGACLSLCDFVAPEGMNDHVGAFAVTVSGSFTEALEALKAGGDQYTSLLMQSVGDRLVEAASEWLHARVRRSYWGYSPDEDLAPGDMFKASFTGIRPAVGYPSLPDQRTIFSLARLLDYPAVGITLTENGAMYPQSSVSGLYIASRHARYFVI